MPNPVVLVHGFLGFSQLTVGGMSIADYFRLIPDALRQEGHIVPLPPKLNAAGSIAERANNLKDYLQSNPEVAGKKVHLIAHSMGGLDSRYLISMLGMAEQVLSLTTIGTPHLGTPIADAIIAHTHPEISQFMKHFQMDVSGVQDLTINACADFNKKVPDMQGIRYFAVAGKFIPPHFANQPLGILGFSHDIIQKKEGINDGLVSVESATFKQSRGGWEFLEPWEGNHFRLINWGTNLVPTPMEWADDTIVNKYKNLVDYIEGACRA